MGCPKCENSQLLEESIDENTKRVKCGKCGFNEIRDSRNAPLLTEVPRTPGDSLLS